jgi:hypothetical protein
MARKIVQLCSAAWDAGGGQGRGITLFALDEDGNVFSLEFDKFGGIVAGWSALPSLPDLLSLAPRP